MTCSIHFQTARQCGVHRWLMPASGQFWRVPEIGSREVVFLRVDAGFEPDFNYSARTDHTTQARFHEPPLLPTAGVGPKFTLKLWRCSLLTNRSADLRIGPLGKEVLGHADSEIGAPAPKPAATNLACHD